MVTIVPDIIPGITVIGVAATMAGMAAPTTVTVGIAPVPVMQVMAVVAPVAMLVTPVPWDMAMLLAPVPQAMVAADVAVAEAILVARYEVNDEEPVIRFELMTNGLQNRCSTTELNRRNGPQACRKRHDRLHTRKHYARANGAASRSNAGREQIGALSAPVVRLRPSGLERPGSRRPVRTANLRRQGR